jgi:hypothetical protein
LQLQFVAFRWRSERHALACRLFEKRDRGAITQFAEQERGVAAQVNAGARQEHVCERRRVDLAAAADLSVNRGRTHEGGWISVERGRLADEISDLEPADGHERNGPDTGIVVDKAGSDERLETDAR